MNIEEQNDLEKRDPAKANMWTAIVLVVTAIAIAIMPFFYLSSSSIAG